MLCNNEFLKVNLVSKYNEGKMLHLMMLMMMMMIVGVVPVVGVVPRRGNLGKRRTPSLTTI